MRRSSFFVAVVVALAVHPAAGDCTTYYGTPTSPFTVADNQIIKYTLPTSQFGNAALLTSTVYWQFGSTSGPGIQAFLVCGAQFDSFMVRA